MKNLIKIMIAGSSVFAIWYGFVVLDASVEEPVKTAEADILSFDFLPKNDRQKFEQSLKDMDMPKPRSYNWNGNDVFFSTRTTDMSPTQVLDQLQSTFIQNGMNKRYHHKPMGVAGLKLPNDLGGKDIKELGDKALIPLDDFFGGGMIPIKFNSDSVQMVGTTTKYESEDATDFYKKMAEIRKETGKPLKVDEHVKAGRFVEAFREGSGKTRITATWSDDENFDLRRIANQGEDLNVSTKFPACPGCKRLFNFQGTGGGDQDFGNHGYSAGNQSVEQLLNYYHRKLTSDGWGVSRASAVMLEAQIAGLMPNPGAKMASYAKGRKFVTVLAYTQADGKARVQLMESD